MRSTAPFFKDQHIAGVALYQRSGSRITWRIRILFRTAPLLFYADSSYDQVEANDLTVNLSMGGSPRRFGTFGTVFTPNVLTILGVILFLRAGWVVGNEGQRVADADVGTSAAAESPMARSHDTGAQNRGNRIRPGRKALNTMLGIVAHARIEAEVAVLVSPVPPAKNCRKGI